MSRLPGLGLVLLALVLVLAVERTARGPLDDADPARQRTGMLIPVEHAVRPPELAGVRWTGRITVVLFTGDERPGPLCAAATHRDTTLVIVNARCQGAIAATSTPARFGIRETSSGRPPVGYALVDTEGRIRYATLDPSLRRHTRELATMIESLE